MSINRNKELYQLLKTSKLNPIPMDSKGQNLPVPDEADVFKVQFEDGEAWITIDDAQQLTIYYNDELLENDENNFSAFLKHLKSWAQRRQLGFELVNRDHLSSDMAKREYMKKEQLGEGYHPMGKKASYSDSIPTVKMIIQHSRPIEEGEQRYRNIARIFVENINGERFLLPTRRPGIAKVYARHIAEGGTPYDERGTHITSLVEEYTKMSGFVRATRNGQFNESAQKLVNEAINHYSNLRETLSRMISHRGYNKYFESYTPVLNEESEDASSLNELFVQETLDPRIESVLPILKRLSKNLNEMNEVKELDEWAGTVTEVEDQTTKTLAVPADEMLEGTMAHGIFSEHPKERLDAIRKLKSLFGNQKGLSLTPAKAKDILYDIVFDDELMDLIDNVEAKKPDTNLLTYVPFRKKLKSLLDLARGAIHEAPGAMSLKHNQNTEKSNLKAFDLAEETKVKYEVINKDGKHLGTWDGVTFVPYDRTKFAAGKMDKIPLGSRVDKESGPLDQAHAGLGKLGMEEEDQMVAGKTPDELKRMRDIPTAQRIKSGETEPVDRTNYNLPPGQRPDTAGKPGWQLRKEKLAKGNLEEGFTSSEEVADMIEKSMGGEGELTSDDIYAAVIEYQTMMDNPHKLDVDEVAQIVMDRLHSKGIMVPDIGESLEEGQKAFYHIMVDGVSKGKFDSMEKANAMVKDMKKDFPDKTIKVERKDEMSEDLDANQKRVGQLGPTEPVGKNEKNLRGKLVGASESVEMERLKTLSGIK